MSEITDETQERIDLMLSLAKRIVDELKTGATAETETDANAAIDEAEALARLLLAEAE